VAKYAVLSEADLARECGTLAGSVSVWARFAQPSRLVWAKGRGGAVANHRQRRPGGADPVCPDPADDGGGARRSTRGFPRRIRTHYGAELRAERKEKPGSIVDADADFYERIGRAVLAGPALPEQAPRVAARAWRRRRRKGKALTLVRLAKASTTFAGGVDYLAWKINRHAGTDIEVKPWQRRWPLLGAIVLLPRLLRRGAIR
jgi:hypothetical protein